MGDDEFSGIASGVELAGTRRACSGHSAAAEYRLYAILPREGKRDAGGVYRAAGVALVGGSQG